MHINIYFLSAVASVVVIVWEALRTFQRRQTHNIEDIVREAVESAITPLEATLANIDKRLVVVETKMDMVVGGVALNSASILHHPEPSRSRVDYLLDVFRDGIITIEEHDELRDHLEVIMNWEPGKLSPYTVFPGEQAAAGLLLATMDHVNDTGELHGLLDPPADSTEEAGA